MIKFSMILALLASPAFAQTMYQSQQSAQAHCPNDSVVWLNTRTDVYQFQGRRWYSNTEEGDISQQV
jgi:hypothetical protein